jgi:hypothetical protein
MIGGLDLRANIWRDTQLADDDVGGSIITGTVVGQIEANLQEKEGEQMLVQQGYETVRQFRFTARKPTFTILEGDDIEIIWPPAHPYENDKFRIVRVKYSNLQPRNRYQYLILECTRSVISHNVQ